MSVAATETSTRFVLHNVSWKGYETLLCELGNRHVFITYDSGTLEFMSPSPLHGKVSSLISRLIWAYSEETSIQLASFGMTTFKREEIEKGLEPDDSFYVSNESLMRGKDEIDLAIDPPPDLVIEVDVTHRASNRLEIYRQLKVGEVWEWSDEKITVHTLNQSGDYEIRSESSQIPGLRPEIVEKFVQMRKTVDELSWIRQFRQWARDGK